jgi:transposase-like protein
MNVSSHEALLSVAPGEGDPLETIVRRGAKLLLQAALEAEVTEYLERQKHARQAEGTEFRGYRNGVGKERNLTVGSGTIKLQVPRVADVPAGQEPFASKLVQPYQRRSKSLDEVFPQLFLEGLATRDFEPALRSLLGAKATLSPSTIVRLNQQFKGEYEDWTKSNLSGQAICYVWVDGIYWQAGIGTERACLLVVIGADSTGKKHLLGLSEGFRESKESWLELLRQLKARGMNEPALAIGDGALGFWAAASECWRWTKQQRCWLHKMRNILDKLPKRERDEAANRVRAIYRAQNRAEARRLAEALAKDWRGLYDKAAECLLDDLERMLTFYEFPEEHWRHVRTTNPIESPFAAIRLRTNAMKRLPTARSGVHLLFQLLKRQEGKWQRLSHPEKLREVKMPAWLALQAAS